MDKRKSNILTFSFGKIFRKNLPIFQKKLRIAFYILIVVVAFGNCCVNAQAAELEQEFYTVSPDVPFDNSELTSINYRLEYLQTSVDEQTEELKEINQNLALAVELLSLILGSITLVIIAIIFLGICRWLYKYLKF